MPPAIRVENLSKRYRIRHGDNAAYRTLRDEIMHTAAAPLRWLRGEKSATTEDFWALQDVSFEVQPGEVVGVIGRNGAGKSTLLKILSRITKPTHGHVQMRGRVGSLLEVGTGFHPELTGRENIFLSGAILGMKRAEIARKFDAIVAFAEIEKFLDTPVKRYSSGMYVRLAFSVAAHLEPDILIIDEVLAVGDAAFQKKCLGRIGQSATSGRTVLFVTHNMPALRQLCRQTVFLSKGRLHYFGASEKAITDYLSSGTCSTIGAPTLRVDQGNKNITVHSIELLSVAPLCIDSGFSIQWRFACHREQINLDSTIEIHNEDDVTCFHAGVLVSEQSDSRLGVYQVRVTVPGHTLNAGRFRLSMIFGQDCRYPLLQLRDVLTFEIEHHAELGTLHRYPGVMHPKLGWEVEFFEPSSSATTSNTAIEG